MLLQGLQLVPVANQTLPSWPTNCNRGPWCLFLRQPMLTHLDWTMLKGNGHLHPKMVPTTWMLYVCAVQSSPWLHGIWIKPSQHVGSAVVDKVIKWLRNVYFLHFNLSTFFSGYLSINRFGTIFASAHAGMTAEGDNSVLMQVRKVYFAIVPCRLGWPKP